MDNLTFPAIFRSVYASCFKHNPPPFGFAVGQPHSVGQLFIYRNARHQGIPVICRRTEPLRHLRRIAQPYSPKLFDQPAPTALPLRRAWPCGARSGRAGKRRCLSLFNDIRACGSDEEGPARRHATRHDQFVIWSSLFEHRWSTSGGRRGDPQPGLNIADDQPSSTRRKRLSNEASPRIRSQCGKHRGLANQVNREHVQSHISIMPGDSVSEASALHDL